MRCYSTLPNRIPDNLLWCVLFIPLSYSLYKYTWSSYSLQGSAPISVGQATAVARLQPWERPLPHNIKVLSATQSPSGACISSWPETTHPAIDFSSPPAVGTHFRVNLHHVSFQQRKLSHVSCTEVIPSNGNAQHLWTQHCKQTMEVSHRFVVSSCQYPIRWVLPM